MLPEQETARTDDSAENVWHALTQMLDVGKFFRTYCYRAVVDLGFTISEMDVLMSLKQHPERNTVKGISETVHLSKGIISQAVESLRRKKVITVHHDENDRRSLLIALTSMAQPVLDKMREASVNFADKIVSGIPTDRLPEIFDIVTRVYSNKQKLITPDKSNAEGNLTGGAALAANDYE